MILRPQNFVDFELVPVVDFGVDFDLLFEFEFVYLLVVVG